MKNNQFFNSVRKPNVKNGDEKKFSSARRKSNVPFKLSNGVYYLGLITQLGLVIIISIFCGLFVGMFLDSKFGNKGIFTLIFIIFGVIGGFIGAYGLIKRED